MSMGGSLYFMLGVRFNTTGVFDDEDIYVAAVDAGNCTITGWVDTKITLKAGGVRQGSAILAGVSSDTGLPAVYIAGGLVSVGTTFVQNWELRRVTFDQAFVFVEIMSSALPIPSLHWGGYPAKFRRDMYALLPGPSAPTAAGTVLNPNALLWQAGDMTWYSNDGGVTWVPLPVRSWPSPTVVGEHAPSLMLFASHATDSADVDYILSFPLPGGIVASGFGEHILGPPTFREEEPVLRAAEGNTSLGRSSVALCKDPCRVQGDDIRPGRLFSTGCVASPLDATCRVCTKCDVLGGREVVPCGGEDGGENSDSVCVPETLALLLSLPRAALPSLQAASALVPLLTLLLWGAWAFGLRLRVTRTPSASAPSVAMDWSAPLPPGSAKGQPLPGLGGAPVHALGVPMTIALLLAACFLSTALALQVLLGCLLVAASSLDVEEGGPAGGAVATPDDDTLASFKGIISAAKYVPVFVGGILLLCALVQPAVARLTLAQERAGGSTRTGAGQGWRAVEQWAFTSPRLAVVWSVLSGSCTPAGPPRAALLATLTNDVPVMLAVGLPLLMGVTTPQLAKACESVLGTAAVAAACSVVVFLAHQPRPTCSREARGKTTRRAPALLPADAAVVQNVLMRAAGGPPATVPDAGLASDARPAAPPAPDRRAAVVHVFASPGLGSVTFAPTAAGVGGTGPAPGHSSRQGGPEHLLPDRPTYVVMNRLPPHDDPTYLSRSSSEEQEEDSSGGSSAEAYPAVDARFIAYNPTLGMPRGLTGGVQQRYPSVFAQAGAQQSGGTESS